MPPKKKPNYEATRKNKILNEINELKEENKDNNDVDVCEAQKCKDRIRPKNEFKYFINGTKSSCISCRQKYKKSRLTTDPEVIKRASQVYNASPKGKFSKMIRNSRYKKAHPEKIKENARNHYEKNKDEINAKRRQRTQEMNEIMEKHRKYCEEHKDELEAKKMRAIQDLNKE